MRCMVFCAADSYRLAPLYEQMKRYYTATLYRDVLHVVTPLDEGDVFYFAYGVLVCWGLTEEQEIVFLEKGKGYETGSVERIEKEKYEFSYADITRIQRDEIILGSRDALTKLAASYGFAQSVKLAFFEEKIDKTIETTRQLPEDLAKKGKIFLSRKEISRNIGALFIEKSSINLHSDILDEPDFFWEYPEHHTLYQDISKCLDLTPRVDVLNTRLGIIGELLEILNDQLNHQHSSTLEWTIIWLILIEVFLALLKDVFHII